MFIGRDDRKCNSRALRDPGYSAVGGGEVAFYDKPGHFIQAYDSIHRGMRSLREMAVIQSNRRWDSDIATSEIAKMTTINTSSKTGSQEAENSDGKDWTDYKSQELGEIGCRSTGLGLRFVRFSKQCIRRIS